jgi:GDPmannose 4,6-dehydratase
LHSVRDAIEIAFAHVGLDPEQHVTIDPRFLRPAEVEELRGDASKAKLTLGWTPQVGFDELMKMMVDADLERLSRF